MREILKITPENKDTFFGPDGKVKMGAVLSVDNTLLDIVHDLAHKAGFVLANYDPDLPAHVNVKDLYPEVVRIYREDTATIMVVPEITDARRNSEMDRMSKSYGVNQGDEVICINKGMLLYGKKCIISKIGPAVCMNMEFDSVKIKLKNPIRRGDHKLWSDIEDWDEYNRKRSLQHYPVGSWKIVSPDDILDFEEWCSVSDVISVDDYNNMDARRKDEVHEILNEGQLAVREGRFEEWFTENHMIFNLKTKLIQIKEDYDQN